MTEPPTDDDADYWAEVQESLADALVEYQQSPPELIELMKSNEYFNSIFRNVFANGCVRGIIGAVRKHG